MVQTKAGQEMQATEKSIDSRWKILGKKINTIIQDRNILISSLESIREELSKNSDVKINDLIKRIGSDLSKVSHE